MQLFWRGKWNKTKKNCTNDTIKLKLVTDNGLFQIHEPLHTHAHAQSQIDCNDMQFTMAKGFNLIAHVIHTLPKHISYSFFCFLRATNMCNSQQCVWTVARLKLHASRFFFFIFSSSSFHFILFHWIGCDFHLLQQKFAILLNQTGIWKKKNIKHTKWLTITKH